MILIRENEFRLAAILEKSNMSIAISTFIWIPSSLSRASRFSFSSNRLERFIFYYNITFHSYLVFLRDEAIPRKRGRERERRREEADARLAIWIPNHRLLCNSLSRLFSLSSFRILSPGPLRPFHIYLRAPRIFRRDTLSLYRPAADSQKITRRKKVREVLLKRTLSLLSLSSFLSSLTCPLNSFESSFHLTLLLLIKN